MSAKKPGKTKVVRVDGVAKRVTVERMGRDMSKPVNRAAKDPIADLHGSLDWSRRRIIKLEEALQQAEAQLALARMMIETMVGRNVDTVATAFAKPDKPLPF